MALFPDSGTSTLETMQRCPSGVARVEMQLLFVNQLVTFLTGGIYTPMEIVITCADDRDADAEAGEPVVTNEDDFDDALRSGGPLLVCLR